MAKLKSKNWLITVTENDRMSKFTNEIYFDIKFTRLGILYYKTLILIKFLAGRL